MPVTQIMFLCTGFMLIAFGIFTLAQLHLIKVTTDVSTQPNSTRTTRVASTSPHLSPVRSTQTDINVSEIAALSESDDSPEAPVLVSNTVPSVPNLPAPSILHKMESFAVSIAAYKGVVDEDAIVGLGSMPTQDLLEDEEKRNASTPTRTHHSRSVDDYLATHPPKVCFQFVFIFQNNKKKIHFYITRKKYYDIHPDASHANILPNHE